MDKPARQRQQKYVEFVVTYELPDSSDDQIKVFNLARELEKKYIKDILRVLPFQDTADFFSQIYVQCNHQSQGLPRDFFNKKNERGGLMASKLGLQYRGAVCSEKEVQNWKQGLRVTTITGLDNIARDFIRQIQSHKEKADFVLGIVSKMVSAPSRIPDQTALEMEYVLMVEEGKGIQDFLTHLRLAKRFDHEHIVMKQAHVFQNVAKKALTLGSNQKPRQNMVITLQEYCDTFPFEGESFEDVIDLIEIKMGLGRLFCHFVENYMIRRFQTKRTVYCYGVSDTGKSRIAQYLDAIFYCVSLTISDETFSLEDGALSFYSEKYHPQIILLDEANVHEMFKKNKISSLKSTFEGKGIKERLMYNNPCVSWTGACVYVATQSLPPLFDPLPSADDEQKMTCEQKTEEERRKWDQLAFFKRASILQFQKSYGEEGNFPITVNQFAHYLWYVFEKYDTFVGVTCEEEMTDYQKEFWLMDSEEQGHVLDCLYNGRNTTYNVGYSYYDPTFLNNKPLLDLIQRAQERLDIDLAKPLGKRQREEEEVKVHQVDGDKPPYLRSTSLDYQMRLGLAKEETLIMRKEMLATTHWRYGLESQQSQRSQHQSQCDQIQSQGQGSQQVIQPQKVSTSSIPPNQPPARIVPQSQRSVYEVEDSSDEEQKVPDDAQQILCQTEEEVNKIDQDMQDEEHDRILRKLQRVDVEESDDDTKAAALVDKIPKTNLFEMEAEESEAVNTDGEKASDEEQEEEESVYRGDEDLNLQSEEDEDEIEVGELEEEGSIIVPIKLEGDDDPVLSDEQIEKMLASLQMMNCTKTVEEQQEILDKRRKELHSKNDSIKQFKELVATRENALKRRENQDKE